MGAPPREGRRGIFGRASAMKPTDRCTVCLRLLAASVALVASCIPAAWRVRDAGTTDAPLAPTETGSLDATADLGPADAPSDHAPEAALVPDAPTADAPTADAPADSMLDVALDAAPSDARDATSEPDAPPPGYALDPATVRAADPIGTFALDPTERDYSENRCRRGFFNGLRQILWSDPHGNGLLSMGVLQCYRLQPSGSTAGPLLETPTTTLPVDSLTCGDLVHGVVGLDACPEGFVMVGLQGDETRYNNADFRFMSRAAPVCARLDRWFEYRDVVPAREGSFFATAIDPRARDDAGVVDGGGASSDTLVPFYRCDEAVPAGALACSFPYRSGNDPGFAGLPPEPRAFFRTCPGGFVPTGYRVHNGCIVGALELECRALVRR